MYYGGVKYHQVRHAVYCRLCKDTVESRSVHDMVFCKCGAVGVDGGIEPGNTILGDAANWESRAMYTARVNGKILWLPDVPSNSEST
jgi:hypothetical protein